MLHVYLDMMSQPCRALYIFLKANQIPFQKCLVHLRKGEHLTQEFANINRFQRVPAIVDSHGFQLSESVAIYHYLIAKRPAEIAEHWYPKNLEQRARIDEYCAWQHLNLRAFGSLVFRARVLGGTPLDDPKVVKLIQQLDPVLDVFEKQFLAEEEGYVNGLPQVSLADLMATTELEQPLAAGHNFLTSRPKIAHYLHRVRAAVGPSLYDEAHQIAHTVRDRVAQRKL